MNLDYSLSLILHCLRWVSLWKHTAALAPRFVFVLWKYVFSLSFCPLLTTANMCASLNPSCSTCSLDCFCFGEAHRFPFILPIVDHSWTVQTIAVNYRFPAKLKFAYCELWGFCYFSSSRLFMLTHSFVKALYVYKSWEGENLHLLFERIPSL